MGGVMEFCKTQQRGSRAICTGLSKGHEGEHNFVLPEGVTEKSIKVNRDTRQFRLASMLAAILDEPQDDPENPAEVRLEQARELLSHWSDAQWSVMGMARELLNLKRGWCLRCYEDPCTVCGSSESHVRPV
jgi:hypothetical protein